MSEGEYKPAVSYLEKALQYNPNYDLAYVFLVDIYVNYLPDTKKYLEYALRGLQLDISVYDSVIASLTYLHLSNAFIQSGFIDEAEKYINKSLEYEPENLYSQYVKAYILYARNRDLNQTKDLLIETLNKDTTRLDILQEVGKIYYYMRDYTQSYNYYKRFIEIRENQSLDIYRGENAKIGFVLSKMGLIEKSENYFNDYKDYAENDKSVYKHLDLTAYFSYRGNTDEAIKQLKLFSQQNNYHYWILLFLKIDPLLDNIKDLPEFNKIYNDIESKFWNNHKRIKASLKEKKLI